MVEEYNSNVGALCDEYSRQECDIDENTRGVIIIDSGCIAHMFLHIFMNTKLCLKG